MVLGACSVGREASNSESKPLFKTFIYPELHSRSRGNHMDQEYIINRVKELRTILDNDIHSRYDNGAITTINEECNFTIGFISAVNAIHGEEYFNRMSMALIPYMRGDSLVGIKYRQ